MRHLFLPLILLSLIAHGAASADPPAASPARGRALRAETVRGVFAGWERGDYLWAQIDVPGRGRIAAQIVQGPIGPFLEAHRGQTLTLAIVTERVTLPEAGETEIQRIMSAMIPTATAEFWWTYLLSREERADAQRRFEAALP